MVLFIQGEVAEDAAPHGYCGRWDATVVDVCIAVVVLVLVMAL